ncbi:lipase 3-like [Pieris brassicae]|uniref:lipase 3-like n=1 Tax=Pieris brassicae TaxID=7116 RepID=UPI001E65EA5C|nr:lipase 3-like [Pieris brassicae]
MLMVISLVIFVAGSLASPNVGSAHKKYYKTHETIAEAGYPVETHDVVTQDGYILELVRIPRGKNDDGKVRPPVLMMHGLSDYGGTYIALGPKQSLAYNLVDEGADVWLANARGVANSRRHITLDPDNDKQKKDFFDFTFHEIGTIDLPALIDYVLKETGQKKLHYVGHSQGGTVFLVLNSMKPEYNDKIISAHLLAGVGYQNNFPNSALRATALSVDMIYNFAIRSGLIELIGPNWGDQIAEIENQQTLSLGVDSRSSVGDILDDIINPNKLLPGASLKQYAHYGQNIRDKKFRQWNYGLQNLRKYGQLSPPEYDLRKITADVTMHYTVNDNLLSEQDVLNMAKVMPNVTVRKIPRDTFTHTDFVSADDAKELVVDFIVKQISGF